MVYEYATMILSVLLITSEILPFIKKTKGNGLCEGVVCLLRGSSCMTERIADVIEKTSEINKIEV